MKFTYSSSLLRGQLCGQFLRPLSRKLDASYFLIGNLWLLVFISLGFLLVAVTILLTHTNGGSRLKCLKQVLFRALFAGRLPNNHLKLLFFCFFVFLFFNRLFLGATIQTDKITIPTDEIVDSTSKLIDTSKKLTFHARELEPVKSAPEGSFLKRLSKKNIFVVDDLNSLMQMKAIGINRFVIFAEETRAIYFLALLSKHADEVGSVAFSKESDYYGRLDVFEMRKSLDSERKRFINNR